MMHCFFLLAVMFATLTAQAADQPAWPKPWLGVHVMVGSDRVLNDLLDQAPKLAAIGVNALIVEVNYSFDYRSHPELAGRNGVTKAGAAKLAEICRKNKIRLIPQFNCLGHQSWAGNTAALLTKHPEFDETPGQYPGNKGIYCRSWCPLHREVNPIIFDLMDELIEAFSADAFHVGMDEVFLIGSEHCTRCKGKDKGELFAKAVNDYHGHLVGRRKLEMLMWADRLLDAAATGDGEWEASKNGTHKAVDLIPKDIVMCDWHYGKKKEYRSVPLLLGKGFRVWPAGWDKPDATLALARFAREQKHEQMMGHLATTWGKAKTNALADFEPLKAVAEEYHK